MYNNIISRLRSFYQIPNLWLSDGEIQNYMLCELKLFNASATSLFKHTLPMPNSRLMTKIQNKMLREELNYDLKNQYSISFPKLNNDQKHLLLCY
jgi:hypothetical protein